MASNFPEDDGDEQKSGLKISLFLFSSDCLHSSVPLAVQTNYFFMKKIFFKFLLQQFIVARQLFEDLRWIRSGSR